MTEPMLDPIQSWAANATPADQALQKLNADLSAASAQLFNNPGNKALQRTVQNLTSQVLNAMSIMQTNTAQRMGLDVQTPAVTGAAGTAGGAVSGGTSGVAPLTPAAVTPGGVTTESLEALYGVGAGGTISPTTGGPVSPVTGQPIVSPVPSATAPATAAAAVTPAVAAARKSAKESLVAWLSTFFDPVRDADTINQMIAYVGQQIEMDVPVDAIELNIRQQPFYQQRFSGNKGLRAAGLAEMTPAEYLAAERQYSDLLAQANLGNLGRRDVFASLIGGQVSAVELQDRIVNVYDRIKNADQALKQEMQRLNQLGNITAADYAESLLLGKEGAASLKRKIAQAEISTEFTTRGIGSALGVTELERLGVTRQQAAAGAEFAKTGTQRLQELASIYGAEATGLQSELEKEAFTGLASQRRKQLTGQERAAFGGAAGTGTPSLGRPTIGAI